MDIEKILSQMSLKDKIALCSGKNFWQTKAYEKYGIPSMFMCDGPHGLRKQANAADMLGINKSIPATCFPAEVTTASSWNPKLMEEIGNAIGEEARAVNVGLVLGPGANMKRNPLCGRNFEYFSEDPLLAGKMAAGFIHGVEGQGVGTSLKHFACNSQEKDRLTSDGLVDERALREIYLTAFEIAVKEAQPSTIMCAYPKLNGIHCSSHKELLTDILRGEWGYQGFVVTDWGAMEDRIKGFEAGCDLSMPGGSAFMEHEVLKAVQKGELSEEYVDASARRILKLVFRAHETLNSESTCDYDKHHEIAGKAAVEGAVLLKNEDGLLPLGRGRSIAVIGHMAKDIRFQGSGSSHINPTKLNQPIDVLGGLAKITYAEGCAENGDTDNDRINEAVDAARKCEKAVVFAGLPSSYESEGFDRNDMKMPEGHIRMIEEVASANPDTVVVLLSGSPVECEWADKVKAILYMGLPGQAGSEAIADLLYGDVSPSGKLSETWPYKYEDVPSSEIFARTSDALYEESIYIGYRYYDKASVPVRWPFGYGLSYTQFVYSGLTINKVASLAEEPKYKVTCTVTNTGKCSGAEVVQLYVEAPFTGIHRPKRTLAAFDKVFLKPGESLEVSFELGQRSFAIWQDGWKVPACDYTICIGSLNQTISILPEEGDDIVIPSWQAGSWYEKLKGKPSQEEFEKVLGRKYVVNKAKKGEFTMENTVAEMKEESKMMKFLYNVMAFALKKATGGDEDNPEYKMMVNASLKGPFRNLQISSGVKGGLFPGLLELANGHFFKGIARMFRK